ncbi:MAG: hypothetical protein KIT36_08720 [Alphaproteobacteria bacterium]|nr:hypothetical protein [Alphaproteobacteria bacterium]
MEKLLCEVLRELQTTNRLIERLAAAIEAQQVGTGGALPTRQTVVPLRPRTTLPIG